MFSTQPISSPNNTLPGLVSSHYNVLDAAIFLFFFFSLQYSRPSQFLPLTILYTGLVSSHCNVFHPAIFFSIAILSTQPVSLHCNTLDSTGFISLLLRFSIIFIHVFCTCITIQFLKYFLTCENTNLL